MHCINQIATTEGVLSFWRSFPVTLVMNIPYNAILVSVYESLKVVYLPWAGEHVSSYFICAGISGGVAALLTTPMDNIKTRL
jgi:solute carrier family 25 iron transporter 28/37